MHFSEVRRDRVNAANSGKDMSGPGHLGRAKKKNHLRPTKPRTFTDPTESPRARLFGTGKGLGRGKKQTKPQRTNTHTHTHSFYLAQNPLTRTSSVQYLICYFFPKCAAHIILISTIST